jgi:sec-independent protein translocase protein TatA
VGDLLSPSHIVFLLIIALLVFGPRKLPELGGAVGKTIKEFQRSMKEATRTHDETEEKTASEESARPS